VKPSKECLARAALAIHQATVALLQLRQLLVQQSAHLVDILIK
jgi:hypothetical protein